MNSPFMAVFPSKDDIYCTILEMEIFTHLLTNISDYFSLIFEKIGDKIIALQICKRFMTMQIASV